VGAHYLEGGDLEGAQRYLERTMVAHEQRMNVGAVGALWFGLAGIHIRRGDRAAAESALDRALEIARAGGNVLFQCWIFPRLAECALRSGDHRAAAQAVENGFRLLTPGEDWRGLPALLHLARGQVAVGERRWSDAEADFETALALNRLYTCVPDEARTLVAWARMRLARGRPDDGARAREQLGQASAIFERARAVCDLEEVKELLGRG
jgi:ATP/maltotriose-dependent transcriptional regulator MalT